MGGPAFALDAASTAPAGPTACPEWWRGPRPDRVQAAIASLPGVRPASAAAAGEALGLRTVADLLWHLPRRYDEYGEAVRLDEVALGDEATLVVVVDEIRYRRTRRRGVMRVIARVRDAGDGGEAGEAASAEAVWYGRVDSRLAPGATMRVRARLDGPGRFDVRDREVMAPAPSPDDLSPDGAADPGTSDGAPARGAVALTAPPGETTAVDDAPAAVHTAGLVPVYPASEQMAVRRLRELVTPALLRAGDLTDAVPARLRVDRELPGTADAVVALHRPRTRPAAGLAHRRLAFEELLVIQLGMLRYRRWRARRRPARVLPGEGPLLASWRAGLPFALSESQEVAIAAVAADVGRAEPMHRLLHGDVGAGKTAVACAALLMAVEAGAQGVLMAPTEVLAGQHAATLTRLLAPAGVMVGLLTGASSSAARGAAPSAQVLVGTHALIGAGPSLRDLAVAVVDEQHRFGVQQRRALEDELGGFVPHFLYMTATPIPRSLALTAYGDLAVTTLAGLPGRRPVRTRLVPEDGEARAWSWTGAQLDRGRQAYVVCPIVEGDGEVAAAVGEAERLRAGPLAGRRIGVLHGRLASADKQAVLATFAAGRLDVLVATTVIEVGVDVPNATVMVIKDADRFGLAQLHQLRGRVGRGEHPGVCLLFAEQRTAPARQRIEALLDDANDGFALAEVDWRIRGEGSVLGGRQSGAADLRVADLRDDTDRRELTPAREAAIAILDADPRLEAPEHAFLRDAVRARFADAREWLASG